MNEKDLNLRRREREAKVPVALWAASGPSRPEDERRQRGRRRRQPASGAKQAVKSFPATKRRKQHRKGAVFSFEYEREGLEPEKARAGGQSAGGTLGSERSEPSGG